MIGHGKLRSSVGSEPDFGENVGWPIVATFGVLAQAEDCLESKPELPGSDVGLGFRSDIHDELANVVAKRKAKQLATFARRQTAENPPKPIRTPLTFRRSAYRSLVPSVPELL